jgi:hypothetical protein
MKLSTMEVEARLRATLSAVDEIVLDAKSDRGHTSSALARVVLVTLAAVVMLGGGWARMSPRPSTVRFQAGSDVTTPFDDVNVITWFQGPLEAQLGTVEGNPNLAMVRLIEQATNGCTYSPPESTVLRSIPRSQQMTVREFVSAYGDPDARARELGQRACGPKHAIDDEVLAAKADIEAFVIDLNADPDYAAQKHDYGACVLSSPYGQIAAKRLSITNEAEDSPAAADLYAKAKKLDVEAGISRYECMAKVYERRRAVESKYVAAFLSDGSKAKHLAAAARLIEQGGLRVPAPQQ